MTSISASISWRALASSGGDCSAAGTFLVAARIAKIVAMSAFAFAFAFPLAFLPPPTATAPPPPPPPLLLLFPGDFLPFVMPGNGFDGDGLFLITGVFAFALATLPPTTVPPLDAVIEEILLCFIGGLTGAGLAGERVFLGSFGDTEGGGGEGLPRLPAGGFGTDKLVF